MSEQRSLSPPVASVARALEESEAFLRLTQHAGHVGSWEWDLATNRFKWSEEMARLHGLSLLAFDGRFESIQSYCHPDDLPKLLSAMQVVRQGDDIRTLEYRIRPRTGGELWLLLQGHILRSDDGVPQRVLGIALDITERKRTEQALAESEARLAMIVREQTEFIVQWLPDGTRTFVNQSYCRYFGVTEAECLGTSFYPLVAPEHREAVRRKIAALTPEQPEAINEHESVTSGGERRWQQWIDRGRFDADGRLVDLISTGRDITDRKRVEIELREMASLHRAILESSLDGLIVMDAAGRVVEFNAAAEAIFGHRREDVIGREMADRIIPPEYRAAHASGMQRYLATRTPHMIGRRIEMPALRADGSEVRVELAICEIPGRNPPLFSGVVRDISERLKLEEQLRQSQKMEAVGQLAGGIAHDFNNLLTVISGYSDLLLQMLPAGDPRAEMAQQIHRAGERSAGLTRQLLAFSRQQVLAPRVIDLNDVVREMEKMLKRLIGEDIALTTQLNPALEPIHADPGQIEQVLLNLAVNARDAMPRGGRLVIGTDNVAGRTGPQVRLTIADTGEGMTPEVQARIFEPFFTTKSAGRGTGLGLAVVHGIIKQSDGTISVRSAPGAGTTFTIEFPAVPLRPQIDKSAARPALPRGNETILLVEDDESVRAFSSHVLKQCGYAVLEAADGAEALRAVAAADRPIDLLVTDVVLPGLGGRLVAERFAQLHPGARILYLSGYTDDAVIRHGIEHERVHFLQKPFTPTALAAAVRTTLSR